MLAEGVEPVELGDNEFRAASDLFGENLPRAIDFVAHLASSGTERGLLGPREVPRLWERHVLNCAVVHELIDDGAKVADVGSGAGLPGIALAIARPDLRLTLIEPLERRVAWLREVIRDLELENVKVLRSRAEAAVGRVDVDVVTARAVSALSSLVGITLPLLRGYGQLLAIKGQSAEAEIDKAAKEIKKLGGRDPQVLLLGKDLLEQPTTVVRIFVGKNG